MREWKDSIRERLNIPELRDLREERIIEEIAGQLEDFFLEAHNRGLPEEEAERQALERFDWSVFSENLGRDERRHLRRRSAEWTERAESRMRQRKGLWPATADLLQDMRFAVRYLRQNPVVTAAAVLCLAIAMGGGSVLYSTAVFTLLQPSPARDPDRVVRVYTAWEGTMDYGSVSFPDFEDLRREVNAFEYAVLTTPMPMNLATEERNRRVWGELVSADYFRCLGVEMAVGRSFLPEEDETEGTHPVAVISYYLWQNTFAADPEIVGRQIHINRHPFTIIGVAEEDFYGDSVGLVMRLWVPVAMHSEAAPLLTGVDRRDDHSFRSAICRMKPGVSFEQAVQQVHALADRLAERYPDIFVGKTLNVLPERMASLDPVVREDFQQFILFGFIMIAFLLTLACANVAGLLLARTAGRSRETGIRMALGAGRGRLMRSLLAESTVLSITAGLFGIVIAFLLNRASGSISVPMDLPMAVSTGAGILWSDIFFIFLVIGIASILIGLTPALHASREDILSALKHGEGFPHRRAGFSRRALVALQVAASFALLVGGGLVLKGMQHMKTIDPGFDPENQLVAKVDLLLQSYSDEEGKAFYRELKDRLHALPGVEAVGMAFNIPLSLSMQTHGIEPEGYENPDDTRLITDVNTVDEGYFAAMGIPMLRGRAFTEFDDEGSPPVVIVNEAFRDRFWPGEDPIGKRVKHADRWHEVIGMVPTGRYMGLGEAPKPYLYYAFGQNYLGMMNIHIRADTDPLALVEPLRREVAELDPTLPLGELNLMSGRISFALMPFRIATGVMWTFGLIAVLLASIGLYGTMAYLVNRQTREIGIRMALGALNRNVLGFVVGRGMRLTFAGLGIGLLFALVVTVIASTVLPGVSSIEPFLLAIPLVLLSVIALVASFFPALRATRIHPVDTLRVE